MTVPHAKIRNALRRLWQYNSPARRAAKARARIKRGLYRCECCKGFTSGVEIDHVVSVGRTPGAKGSGPEDTWDRLIDRLFNGEVRAICRACHLAVTEQRKNRKPQESA